MDTRKIDLKEAEILLGKAQAQIKAGDKFNWGSLSYEVSGIEIDGAQIKRIAEFLEDTPNPRSLSDTDFVGAQPNLSSDPQLSTGTPQDSKLAAGDESTEDVFDWLAKEYGMTYDQARTEFFQLPISRRQYIKKEYLGTKKKNRISPEEVELGVPNATKTKAEINPSQDFNGDVMEKEYIFPNEVTQPRPSGPITNPEVSEQHSINYNLYGADTATKSREEELADTRANLNYYIKMYYNVEKSAIAEPDKKTRLQKVKDMVNKLRDRLLSLEQNPSRVLQTSSVKKQATHITTAKDDAAVILTETPEKKDEAIVKIKYAISEFKKAGDQEDVNDAIDTLEVALSYIKTEEYFTAAELLNNLDTLPLEDKYKLEPSKQEGKKGSLKAEAEDVFLTKGFKIGDTVKLITDIARGLRIGKEGTVVGYTPQGDVRLKFPLTSEEKVISEGDLELVKHNPEEGMPYQNLKTLYPSPQSITGNKQTASEREGSMRDSFKKSASEPAVGTISFDELSKIQSLGIVVTGAGEPLNEWAPGVANVLKEGNLVDKSVDPVFIKVAVVTGNKLGDKGRTDLALVFNPAAKPDVGKLVMWRLSFQEPWLEDFVANYAKDYEHSDTPTASKGEHTQAPDPDWQEFFDFLDDLRESGEVNMFSAPRDLRSHYDLTKEESQKIFRAWSTAFGDREASLKTHAEYDPMSETVLRTKDYVVKYNGGYGAFTISSKNDPSDHWTVNNDEVDRYSTELIEALGDRAFQQMVQYVKRGKTSSLKTSALEPFSEGEKVYHEKLGWGVVQDAQGGLTSVQFGKKGITNFDAARAKAELKDEDQMAESKTESSTNKQAVVDDTPHPNYTEGDLLRTEDSGPLLILSQGADYYNVVEYPDVNDHEVVHDDIDSLWFTTSVEEMYKWRGKAKIDKWLDKIAIYKGRIWEKAVIPNESRAEASLKTQADDNGPSDEVVQQLAWEKYKQHWDALSSKEQDAIYEELGYGEKSASLKTQAEDTIMPGDQVVITDGKNKGLHGISKNPKGQPLPEIEIELKEEGRWDDRVFVKREWVKKASSAKKGSKVMKQRTKGTLKGSIGSYQVVTPTSVFEYDTEDAVLKLSASLGLKTRDLDKAENYLNQMIGTQIFVTAESESDETEETEKPKKSEKSEKPEESEESEEKMSFGDVISLKDDDKARGIFLKEQDSKPGDIDFVCLWLTPVEGDKQVVETCPVEIVKLEERATEDELEQAEEALEKYEEELKEYEGKFEEKVQNIIEREEEVEHREENFFKTNPIHEEGNLGGFSESTSRPWIDLERGY